MKIDGDEWLHNNVNTFSTTELYTQDGQNGTFMLRVFYHNKKSGENERLKKYLRGRIMFGDQLNVEVNKRKGSLVNLLFLGFVTKWEIWTFSDSGKMGKSSLF